MAKRGLVLDANILIRLVLGVRVRDLVLTYLDQVVFFSPVECFDDARKYLPDLLLRRGVDPAPALEVLDHFEQLIRPLHESVYEIARDEALARIEQRDVRDWPILAAALTLGCPIWTEDQDFFGTGVPTWTTDRVELYLNGQHPPLT
ncbi:PIN domain-containing protein [Leekyejoonella antrihumi]|uniref:Nucleotide-binding protein n=1 Tax=Leekyejoonella antrihumi TaxID=1660198 RepID=A0A563E0B6_9MICO|nr:PIN domain-containing protein [Leekyejoonella antrihumi]TWP35324.1 nucleotide-binding protein [Leekyejoonella antrihumi]